MAYNPDGLSLNVDGLSSQSSQTWLLDGSDSITAALADGYITDAAKRGVRVGDVVRYRQWTEFVDQFDKTQPILSDTITSVSSISDSGAATLIEATSSQISWPNRGDLSEDLQNGLVLPDGALMSDGTVLYSYTPGATDIADAPNALPFGDVYADHFAENTTPGTTPMHAAISAALSYADNVYLFDAVYRINETVLITENRKSLIGGFGTTLRGFQPSGDAAVWAANADPDTVGNAGPVNLEFRNIIFQRIGTAPGATLRLTRTTNVTTYDCAFWGGDPGLLMEGTQNTSHYNISTSPTVNYTTPALTQIMQTFWEYSDTSLVKGFSTRFFGGSVSSKTDPGTSLYENTIVNEGSDVFVTDGLYFGAADRCLLVKPRKTTCGGIVLHRTHFDDGGSSFVGATKLKLDTTDPDADRIGAIQMSDCRFSSNTDQTAIDWEVGNDNITAIHANNCFFVGSYGPLVIGRGDAGNKWNSTILYMNGGTVQRWADTDNGVPDNAFDMDETGGVICIGSRFECNEVTDGSAIFRPRANGVRYMSLIGCFIKDLVEANGSGIIQSNLGNVDNLIIDENNVWTDGDLYQYMENKPNGNWGIGVDNAEDLTDLTASIRPGFYRYEEATATGSPGTGSTRNTLIATRTNGGASFFISWRGTNNPENQKIWFGRRSGATGSIIWFSASGTPFDETTVGSLPAATSGNRGAKKYVTDANATTFGSIVAGGGANFVPVFSNGTNWIIG